MGVDALVVGVDTLRADIMAELSSMEEEGAYKLFDHSRNSHSYYSEVAHYCSDVSQSFE